MTLPLRRARPYQRIFDHPEALAHITGFARLVLHAACRADTNPAPFDPIRRASIATLRDTADQIARRGLSKEGHADRLLDGREWSQMPEVNK